MTPRAAIVEARMNLVTAMIAAETGPIEIAEEGRRIVFDELAWVLKEELAPLSMAARDLALAWNRYTQDHGSFFEPFLISEMERFFKAVFDTKRTVALRALDALQDPKNWPFDADLPPEHETNVEAAKAHSVSYDPERRQYVDEDGCPRFDAYGQAL